MHRTFSRFTAILTAIVLSCCALLCRTESPSASAAGTEIPGVDVSKYQEQIDWNAAAQAGEKFAIIRCCIIVHGSDRVEIDPCFEENYENARAAGLAVGAYMYTDAATTDEFNSDVSLMLSTMIGKSFEFPVFLDLESHTRQEHLPREIFMPPLLNALSQIEQAGHSAGVYANSAFFAECIDPDQLREHGHTIWMANYFNTSNGLYSPAGRDLSDECDIWQYSGCGHTGGIRTTVDRNVCYTYKFFNHLVDISDATLPSGVLKVGEPFTVAGTVSAESVIRTVTGTIYDSMGGDEPVQTVTVYPHVKSYNLKGFFSKKLVFSALPEGQYILKITAEDSSGKEISVSDSPFVISKDGVAQQLDPEEDDPAETDLPPEATTAALSTVLFTSTTETETTTATEPAVTAPPVADSTLDITGMYQDELPPLEEGENSRQTVLRLYAQYSPMPKLLNSMRALGESLELERTPLHRAVSDACDTANSVYLTILLMLQAS